MAGDEIWQHTLLIFAGGHFVEIGNSLSARVFQPAISNQNSAISA
jgi:hypothetical protein